MTTGPERHREYERQAADWYSMTAVLEDAGFTHLEAFTLVSQQFAAYHKASYEMMNGWALGRVPAAAVAAGAEAVKRLMTLPDDMYPGDVDVAKAVLTAVSVWMEEHA